MKYERLTDKDWHNTKFMQLNEREILKRLWDLENKIENETLVDLSCKVGDTAYVVYWSGIDSFTITDILVSKNKILYRLQRYFTEDYEAFWSAEYENNVYLNITEAEAKLKELRGEV